MKNLISLLILLLSITSCMTREPAAGSHSEPSYKRTFDSLAWLVGNWSQSSPEGTYFEFWKRTNDTLFIGRGFMVSGKDTLFSEDISLAKQESGIFYIVTAHGQNAERPVAFLLNASKDGNWMFENAAHDFPQQIIYSHPHPDSLVAVVAGNEHGKPRQEFFRMKRQGKN